MRSRDEAGSALIGRRDLLRAGGVGVLLGLAAACGRTGDSSPVGAQAHEADVTVAGWLAAARGTVQIAHRGAGAVAPEHTIAAYRAALAGGATCMEVSTALTKDGALVCHHDLTLDRITDTTGEIASMTLQELAEVRVQEPWLGPAWTGPEAERIPTLEEALDVIGRRAVLCLEAKNDAGFPALLQTVEDRGLHESVFMKIHARSSRVDQAHQAGLPVFAYCGMSDLVDGAGNALPSQVEDLAARLDKARDVLVIPARTSSGDRVPEELLAAAVRTGVPVWVYPVQRRSDVDYFRQRSVQGVITANYAYTAGTLAPRTTDQWSEGRLGAGDLVKDPYSRYDGLTWPEPGTVELPNRDKPSVLMLGSLAPEGRSDPAVLEFDLALAGEPTTDSAITVAFGHEDDRYYEDGVAGGPGYHARVLPAGGLQLGVHVEGGNGRGTPLVPDVPAEPMTPGEWIRYRIELRGEQVAFGPVDGLTITATDGRFRGGYVHVGRSATTPAVRLRKVVRQ